MARTTETDLLDIDSLRALALARRVMTAEDVNFAKDCAFALKDSRFAAEAANIVGMVERQHERHVRDGWTEA